MSFVRSRVGERADDIVHLRFHVQRADDDGEGVDGAPERFVEQDLRRDATRLMVTYAGIDQLPSLSAFTQLRSVWLSLNAFAEVPDALFSVSTLRALSLHGNCLRSLSSRIGDLAGLQFLYLGGTTHQLGGRNKLTVIPDSIGNVRPFES